MTGARCQACTSTIATLPRPLGKTDEPLGSCISCHSLTCGHHGQRDLNKAHFMCVECDQTLLSASAVVSSGGAASDASATSGTIAEASTATFFAVNPPDSWRVASLAEFLRRRPRYGDLFDSLRTEHRQLAGAAFAHLMNNARQPTDESVELLAAAALLGKVLYSETDKAAPPDYLSPLISG